MKREPTELEKIFANDLSDKGLNCPKCTKSLCDSKSKKENNPDKNGQRILTDIFSKEDKKMVNRHIEKIFTTSSHQGNTNQKPDEIVPHNYHNDCSQVTRNNTCWGGCQEKGTLKHCW